jgi:hypothetical protein
MANELVLSASGELEKGDISFDFSFSGDRVTVSGSHYVDRTQEIGLVAEALDIGDITTCGYAFFHNQDDTNYVTIRSGSSGASVVKLKAGEKALFRLATSTPYAIADTAACDIRYIIIED